MAFSWYAETAALFWIMRERMLCFSSVKKLKDALDEIHPTKGIADSLMNIISSCRKVIIYGK